MYLLEEKDKKRVLFNCRTDSLRQQLKRPGGIKGETCKLTR